MAHVASKKSIVEDAILDVLLYPGDWRPGYPGDVLNNLTDEINQRIHPHEATYFDVSSAMRKLEDQELIRVYRVWQSHREPGNRIISLEVA